jgi:DNA replication protein DnaC
MWVNVADLMVQMRSEMSRPDDDRPAARIAIHLRDHPKLVVLDDLGREKASDWTGEVIYSLVNHRYEERLETIVTSNLTAAELGAGPYWPVISRLAEDGRLIDMAGTPDKRLTR